MHEAALKASMKDSRNSFQCAGNAEESLLSKHSGKEKEEGKIGNEDKRNETKSTGL